MVTLLRAGFVFLMSLSFARLPCVIVKYFLPARGSRLWEIGPWLLFVFLIDMPTWIGDENALFLLPVFLLAFLVCYRGPLAARLVTASVLYSLTLSVSMMIDSARWLWNRVPPDYFHLLGAIAKGTAWLLLLLFLRKVMPAGKPIRLSPRMWALAGVLSLTPVFALLSFTIFGLYWSNNVWMYESLSGYLYTMAYIVLPFITLSSAALLFALSRLSSYEQLERERQLDQMNRSYYGQLEQQQLQIRRMRHDMANHLQALAALPQEERDRYLTELLENPALQSARRWSENHVVNAVLSAKAEQMTSEQIRADLSAPLPSIIPIADVDLCALFANSLDNAIEACRKLPPQERQISLKARVNKGLFVLEVKNPFADEPVREGGRFRTSKADRANHGLGLAGMASIAEKYGGSMQAGMPGKTFELLLCIPLNV